MVQKQNYLSQSLPDVYFGRHINNNDKKHNKCLIISIPEYNLHIVLRA